MDYKYIEQLLERYWQCETTLEEEEILRTFFSQKEVPAALLQYKALFTYEQNEKHEEQLGDDFDERILAMIDEPEPVKARTIKLTQRLMPLFKAAAIVAIILTLGNSLQVAFEKDAMGDVPNMAEIQKNHEGQSVAMRDTIKVDSMQQVVQQGDIPIIK